MGDDAKSSAFSMSDGGTRWSSEFRFLLDFTDHEAIGMRREQQLDDAQTRFGSHGGEHVAYLATFSPGFSLRSYISIFAEI